LDKQSSLLPQMPLVDWQALEACGHSAGIARTA